MSAPAVPGLVVRPATPEDAPLLVQLIRELAVYERLEEQAVATPEGLADELFGAHPVAAALVAELDGAPAGYALTFRTFSTFLARPGTWLEDLFVREPLRGRGIGRALLAEVARRALAAGSARLEWSVLDWNAPAIAFYEGLGAGPMGDWTTFRIVGAPLEALAATAP